MFNIEKDYVIVRRINLLEHKPEEYQSEKGLRYIVRKDNKCGVIDHFRNEIIPLIYDNIIYDNHSCYILISNGKMGLAIHDFYFDIRFNDYHTIKHELPCEYDYINRCIGFASYFYVLYKNTASGEVLQIYMPVSWVLTEEFEYFTYFDEGYLELIKGAERKVFDSEGGTLLTADSRYSTVKTYGTDIGRVLYDADKNGNGRLLFEYLTEDETAYENKVVEFEGKLKVVFKSEGGLMPIAVAFKITDKNGETKTINNRAEYID